MPRGFPEKRKWNASAIDTQAIVWDDGHLTMGKCFPQFGEGTE
jgi:hypothetical protein